ncbi:putative domain, di-copper centre [Sesbania bispinosa]|nr:putative domain, di-copper centre [Sesbania bispinosa]
MQCAATLSLSNNPFAFAAPISPPDLSTCGPPDLPGGAKPTNCCPPSSTNIIDFKFPSNQPLRMVPLFYERILGSLIKDPTFALPFWNWDAPGGMQLPSIYADPKSPLYDPLRNANHYPPTIIDLDFNRSDDPSASGNISSNLTIMYRNVVSNGKTPRLFLGNVYRAGDEPDPGAGSVENVPHGPVHIWTGDNKQPNFENMGTFYSAARDPIFYSHHSNIDRMWSIWKTLGGKERIFLTLIGIEFDRNSPVKFDVFINDEDDKLIRPDNTEFAGSFVNVPHSHKHKNKKMNTCLRLGLTDCWKIWKLKMMIALW